MKIKICGIADRDNLKQVAKLKPDFMGFIFFPGSSRYMVENIDPEDLAAIRGQIKKTGVFVNAGLDELVDFYNKYKLDFVQLHGDESPLFCRKLMESGINIIKAFRIGQGFKFNELKEYLPFCEYFLFDTLGASYGGTGKKFKWDLLDSWQHHHPLLLSGGIGPEDVSIIKQFKHRSFAGIDINSRFETEPGKKNIPVLTNFLEEIRNDELK